MSYEHNYDQEYDAIDRFFDRAGITNEARLAIGIAAAGLAVTASMFAGNWLHEKVLPDEPAKADFCSSHPSFEDMSARQLRRFDKSC